MFGNTHAGNHNRHIRNRNKQKIRLMREQMISEQDMYAALKIRKQTFYQILNEIEDEDAESLGFERPKHLSSTLMTYQRQLAYCIAVNRKICESEISSDKDKQESTRIIADCGLTWAKVQMEGPRVLREVHGPIEQFTKVAGSPMPVPEGQGQKTIEPQFTVEQLPDGTGLAIPVPEEEEEEEESE